MQSSTARSWGTTALTVGYVAVVLGIDALAQMGVTWPIDWSFFRWRTVGGADLFKFVAWFAIPFACCLPGMDWGYLGVRRWRRTDLAILGVLAGMGVMAVLMVPLSSTLRGAFPSLRHVPAALKWRIAFQNTVWTLSWLVGWEFLHRYVLLRHLRARWPRFGWLLIPLSEGAYHLTWPTLLMPAGSVAFSLLLTPWALKRRNTLLPFLAHFVVEFELIAFRLVV